MHHADIHAELSTELTQSGGKLGKGAGHFVDLGEHHHYEHILQDGLGHVNDIDIVIGANIADLGEDTHGVLADDGNYSSHGKIPPVSLFLIF